MKIIGLMSGTSLDGLDIACCEVDGCYTDTTVRLLQYEEVKMPSALREKIQTACDPERSSTPLVCSLNFELGIWFGKCTAEFMRKNGLHPQEIGCIASHGQTVFHIPSAENGFCRSTLQLGAPAAIAWETDCRVVSDFRSMDMAAGGEGAPLVPYTDYILYRSREKTRILMNIGGIANITWLKKNGSEEDIIAFDTGPGNMMIDEAMRHFFGKEYDADGKAASSGRICADLLADLKRIPYVYEEPPKSTGRELYGRQMMAGLFEQYPQVSGCDFAATLTAYTAWSAAENIRRFLDPLDPAEEVIVSGGGAHNPCLLQMLASELPDRRVLRQEDLGFRSDAKEAVAFAVLAHETLQGHYANMKKATGAVTSVVLGSITPCPKGADNEKQSEQKA